ncbi:hypothetical protein [Streptomyces sp. NPDC060184]|uniref:hypothetical protein n=1 Tax=Streptomyces sp. NPDC060184 TaxID=3347064 RepID=UPI003658D5D1
MATLSSSWGRVAYALFGRREHHVRARDQSQVVEALERLPLGGSDLRQRLEVAAFRRDQGWAGFADLFVHSPLAGVVWVPLAGMIIFGGPRLSTGFVALILTFFTVGMWRTLLHRLLIARLVGPLMTIFTAFMWWTAVSDRSQSAVSPAVAQSSVGVLVFGSLPAVFWFYRKWRNSVREQAHAYDALAILGVRVADRIHGERHLWHQSGRVRRWCELLENFAVAAAVGLALRDRVDPVDTGLRRQLRDEASRVAEAVRSHKSVLVTANCVEDVERVVESLVSGIDALVREDRAALLVNAPDLPSRTSRLRTMAPRLLPGAVVIGLSFALPLVPGIPPAVESSARWMCVLVGASMILSASPEAQGAVRDVLGKALPFK